MSKKRNSFSDLNGAGRLTKDGITGIVDIVEGIHYNITRLGGLLGRNKKQRMSGISGLVYKNIRSIAGLAGIGFDTFMDKLALTLNEKQPTPEQQAIVAALNGVIGDHLEKRNNPLAIPMQLRYMGNPITSTDHFPGKSAQKIVVLVHGSCMNDLQWNRQGHDHGERLARDFGYIPTYLHYNSGRHISENGREFTQILEEFTRRLPDETELIILAHSMGGLVSRSAYHYAREYGYSWPAKLRKLIFLGTPHHGAPLERGGNLIDTFLEANQYSAPISRLGKIRSAGITDLRYGNIVDEDWNRHDRFAPVGDQRLPVPLPTNVQCYAIAATISASSTKIGDGLVGDGLVPLDSGLGKHKIPSLNLSFPADNQWIGRKMKHLDLLNHSKVYDKIKEWMQS